MAKERVLLSMDKELLERLDAEAKRMGVSRSGMLAVAFVQYVQYKTVIEQLPDMMMELSRQGAVESEAPSV